MMMITPFKDFVHKYNLKKEATWKMKNQLILSSTPLDKVDLYPRYGPFSNNMGIVKLPLSKGTHLVAYINETFWVHMDVH